MARRPHDRKRREGSNAIEFGLVALPFFLLLFGILEIGLMLLVDALVETAASDAARQVRTGTYGVNTYTMDFAAPFGGYKSSGVGREFGPEGLAHYTELKSIYKP